MKYQVTIYFDNPVTRWQYSNIPEAPIIDCDVIQRRTFRWKWWAQCYAQEFCEPLSNVLWRVNPVIR